MPAHPLVPEAPAKTLAGAPESAAMVPSAALVIVPQEGLAPLRLGTSTGDEVGHSRQPSAL